VIVGLVVAHISLLHAEGSNNPLGIETVADRIPFGPYFYIKDIFGMFVMLLFFSFFVFFYPNYLGHTDNYIEANPMVTPAHIVPEW
jgi:quinol-cytochrome oxidoreductase complex cytochrome b subunit